MMAAQVLEPVFTDHDYGHFVDRMGATFAGAASGPLFTTSAPDLWEKYLDGFEPSLRQYHNCNTCRAFVERCGSLVTIDEHGARHSALWAAGTADGTPYAESFRAMRVAVERARITGVFLSSVPLLGEPQKGLRQDGGGVWSHLFVALPKGAVYHGVALTASQAAAEKAEDMRNIARALAEFPLDLLEQAAQLLKSDALYRAEKVLGPVEWLRNLKSATDAQKDHRIRDALIWRAVATAPAGFCHPRASMAGTLLEDIATGNGFEWAAKRFASKMHPLAYQRPQAEPSAGQIEAAEKLVEKLGIARALERRFARLDEIETVWRPAADAKAESGGVFGHLKKGASKAATLAVPSTRITWAKFSATVLPEARRIFIEAPYVGHYCAFTTALHDDAPPILQWDSAELRNPFALYVYNGGSPAARWGVAPGWIEVSAISMRPNQWHGGGFAHQSKGALFVLPGCVDSKGDAGNALFPETMRAELHGARAVIEAYSHKAVIHERERASACGLMFGPGSGDVGVRVVGPAGIESSYVIDRWD
jgi:hypothetical protein